MSFLDTLFASKGKSVLGVDVGSSSLKVVQLREKGGKAVLETYGELALGPYGGGEVGQATTLSPEQVTETLKDLLREAKVTTTSCGVSVPFAHSLLSLVTLPYRKDPKEQKTVVELEARKYIPVPMQEVQFDWFVAPKIGPEAQQKDQRTVEVLLVAVHNDELVALQNIVTGSGLQASFYEIEIFSTIRAVVDEPVKPVMIIDIGAASTKIYIVEHGIVASSHSVSVGGQDITRSIAVSNGVSFTHAEAMKKKQGLAEGELHQEEDLVFSRIFSEAHRVLSQFETSRRTSVASVVLTGGGGVTKHLSEYAKKMFSIDVRTADPFTKTEAPAFMRPVLQEIGPEFAVAVGVALRKLDELR